MINGNMFPALDSGLDVRENHDGYHDLNFCSDLETPTKPLKKPNVLISILRGSADHVSMTPFHAQQKAHPSRAQTRNRSSA